MCETRRLHYVDLLVAYWCERAPFFISLSYSVSKC